MTQEKKLEVLSLIANKLNESKITWSVGGSLLLFLNDKIKTFNFHTIEIDGHDMQQIVNALNEAYQVTDKPIAIICNTAKGKGISYMENNPKWHTGVITDEEYKIAMQDLGKAEVE